MKTLKDFDLQRILPRLDLSKDRLTVEYRGRYALLTHEPRRDDIDEMLTHESIGRFENTHEMSVTHGPNWSLAGLDLETGCAWVVRNMLPGGNFDMANYGQMAVAIIRDFTARTPDLQRRGGKDDYVNAVLRAIVESTAVTVHQELSRKEAQFAAAIIPLRLLEAYIWALNLTPRFALLEVEDEQLSRHQVRYDLILELDDNETDA